MGVAGRSAERARLLVGLQELAQVALGAGLAGRQPAQLGRRCARQDQGQGLSAECLATSRPARQLSRCPASHQSTSRQKHSCGDAK